MQSNEILTRCANAQIALDNLSGGSDVASHPLCTEPIKAVLRMVPDLLAEIENLRSEVSRLQAEVDVQDDFHPEDEGLIEAYLMFLRGQGPCPDISALATESQQRMREQFTILADLTTRDPDASKEAHS